MPRTDTPKTRDMLQAMSVWFGGSTVPASSQAAAEIGARLAALRKERGITQKEFAERLGVSQPMVSDYERGELRLHGELILQITQILDVSADELLGRTQDAKVTDPGKNRRLLRRLRELDQLPKRDQDAVMRTIDAFLSKAG